MQLPWWGWTLLSVVGFSGTALVSLRLASARLSPTTVNFYLFAGGLVTFLLYAWFTKADLRLAGGCRWWVLPLAVTVFVSNYAVVAAYKSSPHIGYVKAVGVWELVLVSLVVAGVAVVRGKPLDLPWWKMAGMALCLAGAVLVCLDAKKAPPNGTGQRVPGAGIDAEDGFPSRPPELPGLLVRGDFPASANGTSVPGGESGEGVRGSERRFRVGDSNGAAHAAQRSKRPTTSGR
jgi:hypothetical protein